MFRQATAFILIIAFLTGSFSKQLLMADYYMNRAAYAKDCINKARPKMHCNGHCQLMKKMQEEEKKDQNTKDRIENLKNQVISSKSFFPAIKQQATLEHHYTFPRISNQQGLQSMPRSCFHPPSALS